MSRLSFVFLSMLFLPELFDVLLIVSYPAACFSFNALVGALDVRLIFSCPADCFSFDALVGAFRCSFDIFLSSRPRSSTESQQQCK